MSIMSCRSVWLKWFLVALCGLLTTLSVHAAMLEANGVTSTYTLIDNVLGSGASDETPDCAHAAFGPHITQVWDSTLGKYVFNFYIHVTPDDDRCQATDRQRNEIKTWDTASSGYLVGYQNDTTATHWYFKLDAGFQPSPSFTHIHQIKGVGGSDIDMPIFTLTPRAGSTELLELIFIEPSQYGGTQTTPATANLSDFKGEWIEAYEQIKHADNGSYKLVLKRISDGVTLLSYTNNSMHTWRSGATWNRPKWGIYRSLADSSYLRDEVVKFAGFCLAKGTDPCPPTTNAAPSVSLTAPANGASFPEPAAITITANASDPDGTIATVNFYNGSTLIGSDTTAPYAFTWTNVMMGSYTLTARALDNNGYGDISEAAAITVTTTNILASTNIYTTAGGTTWVCPANVTSVLVQCWGAGGAGGSACRTPNSGTVQYSGGGAGGAYAKYNSYPVTPGNTYYINVGAGGTNSSTVNDTTVAGGDSWFNFVNSPSATIIAKGGAGGQSSVGNTTATAYGTGGTGTATGSAGDVVYAGGSGATGASSIAGGGGSSAGTGSAGTTATSNVGATAPTGGGNGGTGPTTSSAVGGAGSIPGGGGSGARDGGGTLKAGGAGAAGKVILIYSTGNGAPANNAPVFTADPISKVGATEDVSYTGQTIFGAATDSDSDTLSYSAQAGPAWLSIATGGALSGTPANADVGVNSWQVQVSDGKGGTDTATLNITVANVNDAPVFTADPISKAAATEDAAYSGTISGSATDVDAGATLTYSKVSGPAWLSVATSGALSGTPLNADAGANSWTVQVSDGLGGTDTAVLNITVNAINDAPVFTADPINQTAATEDVAYSVTIAGSATDEEGAALTYSKVSGPAWLSVAANGALSGTPANANNGANSWTVQVSDGNSTDTATLNITVNAVNDAPVFTADPISKASATEAAAYTGQTLSGSATDEEGAVLTYSKVSGPAWLSVASDGTLSGTPVTADVGANSWTVQVSDGNSTDIATLNITVNSAPVNQAPVFTVDPISKANATSGSAYSGQTLSGSATDANGDTLTYSKVSGPAWLSIATSGALTGTPASTNVGANSWTVQVSDGLGGTDTAVLNITVSAALTAAPTFVAAGAIAGGTGTIAPALPAGLAAGDILLLFVETANQAVSISNTNGGTWAEVTTAQGTGTAAGTSATRLTAFWSRYNGTQGAPTVSDSGDHQIARMIAVRGAAASGNPWDVTAGGIEATSDKTGAIPGATTTVANTLVVAAVAGSLPDATSTANFSAWANTNLTSLTERTDNANTSGNGGSLGVATGIKATAGAVGSTTVTHASAAVKGMMSIAIKN